MKLMASTMLSAASAIKLKYSSVLPLLRQCLPDFDEILRGMAINFAFFVQITPIKIANTPLDRSAVLVLSMYTVYTAAALTSAKSI